MKKPCKVEKLLSSFIDGELPEKEAALVSRHLAICPDCQKEFEALQSIDHMLLGLEEIEPSYDFARGFWQKVDERQEKKVRWSFSGNISNGAGGRLLSRQSWLYLSFRGVVLFQKSQHPSIDPSGILIAENLEFYSNFEVVDRLELFENWDVITEMEDI